MSINPNARIIPCPTCGLSVSWSPAPTQLDTEDIWGPFNYIPDWILIRPDLAPRVRLSPPDESGQSWLLVTRLPGEKPSHWPAVLNCPRCSAQSERARRAWNDYLSHAPWTRPAPLIFTGIAKCEP